MAETTGISWTDSTFNAWIGCTRVSPACDRCYAATWAARFIDEAWGGPGTGVGFRRRTAPSNWAKPRKWNRVAAADGRPHFVFCSSLSDVFDNQVDPQWRADLFALIRETPALTWLLLTKRPQLIVRLALEAGGLPPNVALGATMVLPEEVARDAPYLAKAKEILSPAFTFVSAEPLLGDIAPALHPWMPWSGRFGIDWLIVGGESGAGARPMHPDWVRACRDLAIASGAVFHFKQWGEWLPFRGHGPESRSISSTPVGPNDTRPWEFAHIGKVAAGHMLEGVAWQGRPAVRP